MGQIVLLLVVLIVGANALSRSVIHSRWPHIKPENINVDRFEDDSRELEPTESCKCGVKKINKIIGGNYASTNEYPWMAALCYENYCTFISYFCGGSLINDQYIITAAHCVEKKTASAITVSLGENWIANRGQPGSAEYTGEKIVIHKDFDASALINNIALIKLNIKVEMTAKISPICLPPAEASYEGKNAYITGWGDISGIGAVSGFLKEAPLRVIPEEQCKKAYGVDEMPSGILCAKSKRSGPCEGDSGDPFVYRNSQGYYELIGVTMGGIECAKFQHPPVFSAVSKYLKFIKENTEDAQYCTNESAN